MIFEANWETVPTGALAWRETTSLGLAVAPWTVATAPLICAVTFLMMGPTVAALTWPGGIAS